MSVKFAAATLLCSLGLALFSDAADARCCCRRARCCAPAPTCCAPAPSCAAPASPAPQPETAPAPSPTAALPPAGDPALAQNGDGRQTFRSYSYDSSAASGTAPAANRSVRKAPESNMFRANWKLSGVRY